MENKTISKIDLNLHELRYQRPDLAQFYALARSLINELGKQEQAKELDEITEQHVLVLREQIGQILSQYRLSVLQHLIHPQDEQKIQEVEAWELEVPVLITATAKVLAMLRERANELQAEALAHILIYDHGDKKILASELTAKAELRQQLAQIDELLQQTNIEVAGLDDAKRRLATNNAKERTQLLEAISEVMQHVEEELTEKFSKLVRTRCQLARLCQIDYWQYSAVEEHCLEFTASSLQLWRQQFYEKLSPLLETLVEQQAKRLKPRTNQWYEALTKEQKQEEISRSERQMILPNQNWALNLQQPENKERLIEISQKILGVDDHNLLESLRYGYTLSCDEWLQFACSYSMSLPSWQKVAILLPKDNCAYPLRPCFTALGHALADYSNLLNFNSHLVQSQPLLIKEITGMCLWFLARDYYEDFYGENAELYRDAELISFLLNLPTHFTQAEFEHYIYQTSSELDYASIWQQIAKQYQIYDGIEVDGYFSAGKEWQLQTELYFSPYISDYRLLALVTVLAERPYKGNKEKLKSKLNRLLLTNPAKSIGERLRYAGFSYPLAEDTLKRASFSICDLLQL